MNEQLFQSIMSDKRCYPDFNNLDSQLTDLKNVPESWVNSLGFDKSFDEMSKKEQHLAISTIKTAIENWYK